MTDHDNQWMKPVGSMGGQLIGSIWGPIGGFIGKQAGGDIGGMFGDAFAGNWDGVGQDLGQSLKKGLDPLGMKQQQAQAQPQEAPKPAPLLSEPEVNKPQGSTDGMPDFKKRAYDFYTEMGYKPPHAAALAGHLDWESGGGNPGAVGDGGKSNGLAQWDNSRFAGLQSFAKQYGLDPKAERTQLQYVDYELKNGESPAGKALAASQDLKGANDALMGYFRPQGYTADNPMGGHGYVNRYNNGASLLNEPAMTQTLAMPPSTAIGSAGDPAMQQPDPAGDPSSAARAMMMAGAANVGNAKPGRVNDYAATTKAGLGLLASDPPQQQQIAPLLHGSVFRGDPRSQEWWKRYSLLG